MRVFLRVVRGFFIDRRRRGSFPMKKATAILTALLALTFGLAVGAWFKQFETQLTCDTVQVLSYDGRFYRCVEYTRIMPGTPDKVKKALRKKL